MRESRTNRLARDSVEPFSKLGRIEGVTQRDTMRRSVSCPLVVVLLLADVHMLLVGVRSARSTCIGSSTPHYIALPLHCIASISILAVCVAR